MNILKSPIIDVPAAGGKDSAVEMSAVATLFSARTPELSIDAVF